MKRYEIKLESEARLELEKQLKLHTTEYRLAERAKIILLRDIFRLLLSSVSHFIVFYYFRHKRIETVATFSDLQNVRKPEYEAGYYRKNYKNDKDVAAHRFADDSCCDDIPRVVFNRFAVRKSD